MAEVAKEASVRKRRRGSSSDEAKAVRAEQLASLGELSAARRALEGAVLAPGTLATLAELTNPVRRPPRPRDPVPVEILEMEPDEDVQLDDNLFAKNIRIARRGAAPRAVGDDFRTSVPFVGIRSDVGFFVQSCRFLRQGSGTTDDTLGFTVGTDDSSPQTIRRHKGHRGW